jgi:hypothetical protein
MRDPCNFPWEKSKKVDKLLSDAEVFLARRPPKKPVCLRLDPFDVSMVKRIASRKGVPFTQLMPMWLHEKIEGETSPWFKPLREICGLVGRE